MSNLNITVVHGGFHLSEEVVAESSCVFFLENFKTRERRCFTPDKLPENLVTALKRYLLLGNTRPEDEEIITEWVKPYKESITIGCHVYDGQGMTLGEFRI